MAIEWCGIIARMKLRSSTVTWLRTRYSIAANTITLPVKIAIFAFRFVYIASMKDSMITAMVAPISTAM